MSTRPLFHGLGTRLSLPMLILPAGHKCSWHLRFQCLSVCLSVCLYFTYVESYHATIAYDHNGSLQVLLVQCSQAPLPSFYRTVFPGSTPQLLSYSVPRLHSSFYRTVFPGSTPQLLSYSVPRLHSPAFIVQCSQAPLPSFYRTVFPGSTPQLLSYRVR